MGNAVLPKRYTRYKYIRYSNFTPTDISEAIINHTQTGKIQVYPDSRYKFNDMQTELTSDSYQTVDIEVPITGYVKIKDATIT